MNLCRTQLKQGVALNTVTTDRFKTAFFTVNLFVPLQKETASAYSLLTDVLMRGTESYPTMQALNQKQDMLYSLGLGAFVQKKGEAQVVTFELTAIDDSFAFDGMAILAEGMKLMQELIFRPYLENGLFKADYVEQEKKNLCDDIRGRINNKTAYARSRCVEIMCEGEPYAVDHGGNVEDVEALTPASLLEAYRNLLASARVEMVYVVCMSAEELTARRVAGMLPYRHRANADLPVQADHGLPHRIRFAKGKLPRHGVVQRDLRRCSHQPFVYERPGKAKPLLLLLQLPRRIEGAFDGGQRYRAEE